MNRGADWRALGQRIRRALHVDDLARTWRGAANLDALEWVIAYRTSRGYCCLYHDEPIEFDEIEDVEVWAEETGVRPYFIGL